MKWFQERSHVKYAYICREKKTETKVMNTKNKNNKYHVEMGKKTESYYHYSALILLSTIDSFCFTWILDGGQFREDFIAPDIETAIDVASLKNNFTSLHDYFSITRDYNLVSQLQVLCVENVFPLPRFLFIARSFPLSFGFIRLPAVMFSHTGRCLWPLHKLQARVVGKATRALARTHARARTHTTCPCRRHYG